MRRDPVLFSACLALAIALGATRAHAQAAPGIDDEARIHFELARRYYDTGRFREAAQEFEEAYRLSPHDELLFNIYLAYRDAGEDARALESLRRFVASLPEGSERRAQLESRVRVLESRTAAARAGEEAPDAEPEPREALLTSELGAPLETPAPADAPEPPSGLGAAPWVIVGAGGVLLGGALVTGLLALDARASLDRECPTRTSCAPGFEDTQSTGEALAITTDVLWIAGATTALTGLVLAIVDAGSGGAPATERQAASTPRVGAACGPRGCGLSLEGSF